MLISQHQSSATKSIFLKGQTSFTLLEKDGRQMGADGVCFLAILPKAQLGYDPKAQGD